MSYNKEKIMALTGVNAQNLSLAELKDIFHHTLREPMHGLCFSPYVENQKPGDQLTEEQIRRRIEIIQPHTQWVRSFSCTEGNELIPANPNESLERYFISWRKACPDELKPVVKEIGELIGASLPNNVSH